ncbi:hypothetical protein [Microbacterium sp. Se5.02b]|nr:hypothetical protein [Microbacterium sp. Se5.02b]QYM65322.1 hypothetical protein K1X59_05955 [Microbacterium sp. Se5.02b]
MIAVLVDAERVAAARDPYQQHRRDALAARDRARALRARTQWRRRARAILARGIRRLAEAVEPPRAPCAVPASDPC